MPYTERTLKSGKVEVRSPHGVKSYGSTPENAKKQENLLRAVDHGWMPTHKPSARSRNAMAKRLGMS